MQTRRNAVLFSLVILPLFTAMGCSGKHTVTLKITGTTTSEQRDEISEKAKSLTDGSSNYFSSYQMNDSYSVSVGPVTDVDAFVKQIDFGKVTKVEGRTIYVDVNAKPEAASPAATDPAPADAAPMEETPMDAATEE